MKVALAQLAPKLRDKGANLDRIEKAVASSGADLVMFGELFLTGYMARDAKGRHLFNTSVLVAPDGGVERYRKIHPANFGAFEEGLYFGRGSDLVLADTKLGKLGLLICYDAFFPELAKAYALQGADALVVISAAPATSKTFFDRILPARAIEDTIFVLYTNLVGTELNMVFQGGTQAIGPRGEDLGRANDFEEDVVIADIDLRHLRVAREFRPTVRDTRREFWEPIAPGRRTQVRRRRKTR